MFTKRWAEALLCILSMSLLGVTSGCSYVENRLSDLGDVGALGLGLGLKANVRGTQYAQLGTGWCYTAVRLQGRTIMDPVGPTGEFGLAPLFYYRGGKESRAMVLFRTLIQANKVDNWYVWYDRNLWFFFPDSKAFEKDFDRRFLDIGASLYLFLGLDLDLSPVELADFLLGIFGADIVGDDAHPAAEEKPAQEKAP